MRLLACSLLADENIHPDVAAFVRQQGCDFQDVYNAGLAGQPDEIILQHAYVDNRILITHDSDFGRLAILSAQPIRGIVYLRPGHIDPQFTIATIQTINAREFDLTPSFILVAYRREHYVRMRLKRW